MRNLRETENPNVVGKSRNNRFKRVDLPAPDGPENTKNDFGNAPFTTKLSDLNGKNFLLTIERAFSNIETVLGEVKVEKWLVIGGRVTFYIPGILLSGQFMNRFITKSFIYLICSSH